MVEEGGRGAEVVAVEEGQGVGEGGIVAEDVGGVEGEGGGDSRKRNVFISCSLF